MINGVVTFYNRQERWTLTCNIEKVTNNCFWHGEFIYANGSHFTGKSFFNNITFGTLIKPNGNTYIGKFDQVTGELIEGRIKYNTGENVILVDEEF